MPQANITQIKPEWNFGSRTFAYQLKENFLRGKPQHLFSGWG